MGKLFDFGIIEINDNEYRIGITGSILKLNKKKSKDYMILLKKSFPNIYDDDEIVEELEVEIIKLAKSQIKQDSDMDFYDIWPDKTFIYEELFFKENPKYFDLLLNGSKIIIPLDYLQKDEVYKFEKQYIEIK